MIKLVVYLGNKGDKYKNTRHNIGWMFEESLNNYETKNKKFNALYYKENSGIIHLLPQTFMNKSGESVVKAMQFFKIDIKDTLVVHDELETKFGSFKLKKGGGLAGHNGLRSIANLTGSKEFNRLVLGISRPSRGDVASYVLQRFSKEEEAELDMFFSGVKPYFYDFLNDKYAADGKAISILQQI